MEILRTSFLLYYLEYGFPLCVSKILYINRYFKIIGENPLDIDAYFAIELQLIAIVGPSNDSPDFTCII